MSVWVTVLLNIIVRIINRQREVRWGVNRPRRSQQTSEVSSSLCTRGAVIWAARTWSRSWFLLATGHRSVGRSVVGGLAFPVCGDGHRQGRIARHLVSLRRRIGSALAEAAGARDAVEVREA